MIGKPKWPTAQFNAYLEELMVARGIDNRAELSRLSGVGQQQLSQWRHGKNKPTDESLEKLAVVLRVPVLALQLKAGLVRPDELETPPDTTVLPPQYERSLAAYQHATREHPDLIAGLLERVEHASEWFWIQVDKKKRPKS